MTCGVVSECAEGRLWRSPSFTNAEDHSLGRVRRVASQGHGGGATFHLGGCVGCLQTGMFTHTDAGEDSGWSLEGKSSGGGGQMDRCSY